MPKEIPYWVTETHAEHVYKLVLFESNDSAVEDVDLTRDEYIALKQHIAAMRGYLLPDDLEARIEELAHKESEEDSNQTAQKLAMAREVYRLWPELVVVESAAFDEELKRIEEMHLKPGPAASPQPKPHRAGRRIAKRSNRA